RISARGMTQLPYRFLTRGGNHDLQTAARPRRTRLARRARAPTRRIGERAREGGTRVDQERAAYRGRDGEPTSRQCDPSSPGRSTAREGPTRSVVRHVAGEREQETARTRDARASATQEEGEPVNEADQ